MRIAKPLTALLCASATAGSPLKPSPSGESASASATPPTTTHLAARDPAHDEKASPDHLAQLASAFAAHQALPPTDANKDPKAHGAAISFLKTMQNPYTAAPPPAAVTRDPNLRPKFRPKVPSPDSHTSAPAAKSHATAVATPHAAPGGLNLVLSNDDGWAENNIRQLYRVLVQAGHAVVLSAPTRDHSGSGSRDVRPEEHWIAGCDFHSCGKGITEQLEEPGVGRNVSDWGLNYVKSYPVTAMRYGLETFARDYLADPVDLALSGINEGGNVGWVVSFSGTVGAAVYAAKHGYPAIAFSGAQGGQKAWNVRPVPAYSTLYAALATKIIDALVAGGGGKGRLMPHGSWLNVNFPPSKPGHCDKVEDFEFVFSRIDPWFPLVSGKDVKTCGKKRLPTEATVLKRKGCFVSISVGDARDKTTAGRKKQKKVHKRLEGLLTCLPGDYGSTWEGFWDTVAAAWNTVF